MAQPVLALRRRQEAVVLGSERPDELRPALWQVLPDPGRALVGRLGRVLALGVPAGLLDGAAGLRPDLYLEPRHPRRLGRPAAGQGMAVGRTRRVLVAGNVPDHEADGRR